MTRRELIERAGGVAVIKGRFANGASITAMAYFQCSIVLPAAV